MKKTPELIESANLKMRDAVKECLPLFESMSLRSDALDEYWHTVFHRDPTTGEVNLRFVNRHTLVTKQRDSARRAHALIKTELEKSECRILNKSEAKRLLAILHDAITCAGFKVK